MARPQKAVEPLTKRLAVRLTQADYDRYLEILQHAQAGNKKYTASDFIRDAIYNRPLPVITKKLTSEISSCDHDRIRMLRNTTNNINQLAKAANIAMQNDQDQLVEILQKLEDIATYIKGELC